MEFQQENPMKLKNKNLNFIVPKGNASKSSEIQTLSKEIIEVINSKYTNLDDVKNMFSFLIFLCNCIENNSCKKKFDKKKLAIELVIKLFPSLNNETDLNKISNDIEDICENKLIKKITQTTKIYRQVKNFFLKD